MNDAVVVSCSLTADSITSSYTTFIVGSSNTAISESAVDGTGSYGGVNLAKLTATAPASSSTSAQATITLLSYSSSDIGLRLGCSNTLVENGFTYTLSGQKYLYTTKYPCTDCAIYRLKNQLGTKMGIEICRDQNIIVLALTLVKIFDF